MDSILQAHVLPGSRTKVEDFKTWLRQARAGDAFVYHCGFLAVGLNHLGEVLDYSERRRLADVAHCAWSAATKGSVHLLQRRVANNRFEYLAVARPRVGHDESR
jgi:hypothetical protein